MSSPVLTALPAAVLLSAALLMPSCRHAAPAPAPPDLPRLTFPSAPDYADPSMWYVSEEDTTGNGCDIFYICSTSVPDWTDTVSGCIIHHADVYNEYHRGCLLNEMQGIDVRFSGSNLYIPYYRQATVEACLADTSLFLPTCLEATPDILDAFRYFLEHLNAGRPFVIMGYSQGGFDVIELLKRLPPEAADRLVAAYVIGYKVTEEDLRYPSIIPAEGETDTGVTVCFNTVRTPDCRIPFISDGTAIGINPVNWRTDAAPAAFRDSLTVALDPASHLTCVSGFTDPYPPLPYVGRSGNYHHMEIRFFGTLLSDNVLARTRAWREAR